MVALASRRCTSVRRGPRPVAGLTLVVRKVALLRKSVIGVRLASARRPRRDSASVFGQAAC